LKPLEIFETRLRDWADLRSRVANLPLDQTCDSINRWWFQHPWCPYRLHWDDQATWPDPWLLLEEPAFCDLARGLGIMYTIAMLDRPDLQSCFLLEDKTHNLVLVHAEKYILNYSADNILNTSLDISKNKKRKLTLAELKTQIR
jgi:hypothetical protein